MPNPDGPVEPPLPQSVLAASEDPNTAAVIGLSLKEGSHAGRPVRLPGDGVGIEGSSGTSSGVSGTSSTGSGVSGSSDSGIGVSGSSTTGDGILGTGARNGVHGQSSSVHDSGVWGENIHGGYGVSGSTESTDAAAVWGDNKGLGPGVSGTSALGDGVFGRSSDTSNTLGPNISGVHGQGMSAPLAGGIATTNGVWGENTGAGDGVVGTSISGNGVRASSVNGDGVHGTTSNSNMSGVMGENTVGGNGVYGKSLSGNAVAGSSQTGNAGHFVSQGAGSGVAAINNSQPSGQVPSGFAVWASSNNTAIFAQGTPAGYFKGDVLVTGDIVLVNQSGDVAEDFDVEAAPLNAEPGTVLIIQENGNLRASDVPYDTRVAGVVAGAGILKPALVLQRVPSRNHRSPIALIGKVFCKVDATPSKIIAGDLLTTSSTAGHAMKAVDKSKALGAIVGKALGGLEDGLGLIPILVSPR